MRRWPKRHFGLTTCLLVGGILCLPRSSFALQVHGEPEGLVIHELAHLFFGATMGLLAYWLESNRFIESRGWRNIQVACLLLVLWNLVALTGHLVSLQIQPEMITGEAGTWSTILLADQTPWATAYFFLNLDHLFCVPAVFFLLLGFRQLYGEIVRKEKSG
ncbi:MAG: hypothetical protein AB1733_07090 [Thermodesulfobacteriota bacterium]